MAKLKFAPYAKQQDFSGQTPVKICLGVQARAIAEQFNEMGKSADEIALEQGLGDGGDKSYPCVVVDAEALAHVENYQLAPPDSESITLITANNGAPLSVELMERIYLHLVKTTRARNVILCSEAGELLEDVSRYIGDIRAGHSHHWLQPEKAQELRRAQAEREKPRDNKPYIDQRTENGREGLYWITPKFDKDTGAMLAESAQWLSDCVEVAGVGRNRDVAYLIVKFTPENTHAPILEAVPMEELGEKEGWKRLKRRGLNVTTSSTLRTKLADYLQTAGSREPWTITDCTGWQSGVYILPNGEILTGEQVQECKVLFVGKSAGAVGYGIAGTAESWREAIGDKVRLNFSMMLGVAAALSAPLAGLVGADSFGVHLFGGSTSGKTTTANIASSIYGEPEKSA